MRYAEVAVLVRARAVDRLFDYLVPEGMELFAGDAVEVPFGAQRVEGYVLALKDHAQDDSVSYRAITQKLSGQRPPLTKDLIELLDFMRKRYFCTWAAAVSTVLPPVIRSPGKRYYQLDRQWVALHGTQDADADLIAGLDKVFTKKARLAEATLLEKGFSRALLTRFVRQGCLTLELGGSTVSRRSEIWVNAVPDAALNRVRSAHKRELLILLQEKGAPQRYAELLEQGLVTSEMIRSLKAQGLVQVISKPVNESGEETEKRLALTEEQRAAVASIVELIDAKKHETILLQGVTGSGKTEVYLQAIERALQKGLQALVMVPEIALTTQIVARFRRRFGSRVAVLHSRMSERERRHQFASIYEGVADVVVGARSAVFAPLDRLGLLVIDEEHEATYKQDRDPRYVAREIAAWRAARANAPLILGSATPSLEVMYRVESGRYTKRMLKERATGRPLPEVRIVDMRQEMKMNQQGLLSRALRDALKDSFEHQEQAVLLLNRRGFSSFLLCRECGETLTCPHCDVTLTVHRTPEHTLLCHFCNYRAPLRDTCPACGGGRMRTFGAGTQQLEQEVLSWFPNVRVLRMDVDTTAGVGTHEQILSAFSKGEADVLLGTQMIAKGHDFSRVSLVGVVAADAALHVPDFRSAERTFQLLVQVAGRAGRHGREGRVVIQTFAPDHYAIQAAAAQDYEQFYRTELPLRRRLEYPPFTEIAQFIVTHDEESKAREGAQQLHHLLEASLKGCERVQLLSAAPAVVGRIRGAYRYQVVVKYHSFRAVSKRLREAFDQAVAVCGNGVSLHVDINSWMTL
ncbi:primosomal protein N' [Ferroacidibacillus organovorans]|uniref:Replication restart protein PriA n=1 Tax=Ferroacidibacillus organovorans TaxID=1765683 RepID=A0A162SEL1_9BACL|nr:primosomal protein N' [Ferroacidibacillus organovorans]KYP79756.1 hypothetical protein AYJ22_13805 [Ferroacidibacillus organovorans]OAG92186.1 hypothetical protein AYW79_13515 [Ferroacidibacillus organovorans]OPG16185.1 primosomal protein N' [Ferroacidibacillus organovorans]